MQNERDESPSSPGWWPFVKHHLDSLGWSGPDFEKATGIARGRLGAWREGALPNVETARAVAEGFGLNVATVFVAAGFATAAELGAPVTVVEGLDLRSVPTSSLRGELRRREDRAASAQERALALLEEGDLAGARRELRSAQTPPSDTDIAAAPDRYSVGSVAGEDQGGAPWGTEGDVKPSE
ncbi:MULTISPECIES: hypothetical protein [Actinosynnema]|uniref:hypothetical protein n=1 Tax=Actinosynnema TaxID=40566 RepID=UPI0012FE274A|nr:hypothetical protein [Actinosynnema pretiosum]